MSDEDGKGYRKPPRSTQFKKGQSGNPNGRPIGRHRTLPYERVLGLLITLTENGVEKKMTVEEAFLQKMFQEAVGGNVEIGIALQEVLLNERRRQRELKDFLSPIVLVLCPVPRGSVIHHLNVLGITKKLYARQPHATIKIENWIIKLALARLGERRLTVEEQRIVVAAARNPAKIKWPSWWKVKG